MINSIVAVDPEGPSRLVNDVDPSGAHRRFSESTIQDVNERVGADQVTGVRIGFVEESVPGPTTLGFEAMKEDVFWRFLHPRASRAESIPMSESVCPIQSVKTMHCDSP